MKQKKRNRLLALVVTLVLIVGLMPGEAAASTPDTKWTDYAADSFAGGSGTKDDPYQIATAEQLATEMKKQLQGFMLMRHQRRTTAWQDCLGALLLIILSKTQW